MRRSKIKNEDLALLGLSEEIAKRVPNITGPLNTLARSIDKLNGKIGGSPRNSAIYFLRCSNAPEATEFLKVYDQYPTTIRSQVPIEAFCLAAHVDPYRLIEIIAGTAWRVSTMHQSMLSAHFGPDVISHSISVALGKEKEDGYGDRMAHLKALNYLPVPKTAQTIVQVNNTRNQAIVAEAPPPERTIRTLVDRFNENRQLTETQQFTVDLDIPPPSDDDTEELG